MKYDAETTDLSVPASAFALEQGGLGGFAEARDLDDLEPDVAQGVGGRRARDDRADRVGCHVGVRSLMLAQRRSDSRRQSDHEQRR